MSEGLYVGVDLGTQSVKVCVADAAGRLLAEASRPLTSVREGPTHEQLPQEWITAGRDSLAAAIGLLSDRDRRRIAAVATCGTSGTLTLVDGVGVARSPGIMYDDSRAAELTAEVAAADPARWERLGYRIQPSWPVTTMVQLARSGAAHGLWFAHQPDVFGSAMTGHRVATDWSSALKSAYDLLDLTWPIDTFAALGIEAGTLPEVVAPGTVLGHSTPAWESATGLPASTPVVAGMTDGCASQLGAGAMGEGDWHSVIGTTLVLKGVTAAPVHDEAGAIYSHRSPEDGRWLPGGASSVGARAISSLLPEADLTQLGLAAEAIWAGGGPVPIAYPLIGTGERFPFVRRDATGFVRLGDRDVALSWLGTDAAAYLTVMQGVALVERLCFDVLAARGAPLTGRLSTSGGGTRSELWMRIRATMLRQPIAVPRSSEPSLGMAVLAASAIGGMSLTESARRMTTIERVIEPDRRGAPHLEDTYRAFRALLDDRGWMAPS